MTEENPRFNDQNLTNSAEQKPSVVENVTNAAKREGIAIGSGVGAAVIVAGAPIGYEIRNTLVEALSS